MTSSVCASLWTAVPMLRLDTGKRVKLRNGGINVHPVAHGRSRLRIVSKKNDLFRVLNVVVRTGKDGLDFGTKMLPASLPRPVAQATVVVLGIILGSLLLRSLLSTVTFMLGIGGMAYVAYKYFDMDDDEPGERDDSALEEAKRIMEKYR